jgi:phosphatidylinositol glycan class O
MDNETVLLLYGDHGMTNDGNHGGGSLNEIKTVLFGYSKSGFPMLHKSKKIVQMFESQSFSDLK